uniref:SFRICE_039255 n=1 Tax=Spodoptera frugiperda TaxID=7108 RepID=A0A2H1VZI9_SPOFR
MSSETTNKNFSNLETPGYVGFANLPNQVHRKSVKKGFEFTLMVVGESGLGKSTLVNSLFLTDLYPERVIPDAIGKCNLVLYKICE